MTTLGDFAVKVSVEFVDRLLDHTELVEQKVGCIVVVAFGVEKRPGVLGRCL